MLDHGLPTCHVALAAHHELCVISPTKPWSWACTTALHHQMECCILDQAPGSPWRHKCVTWRSGPKPMVSSSTHLWPHGSSLWPIGRGRKDSGLVCRKLCISGLCLKGDSYSTTGPSWDSPGGQEKGILPVGGTSGSAPGCRICSEGGQTCDYVLIQGLWSKVWLVGQGLGRCTNGKLVRERNLGKKYVERPFWAKKVKIFVSHVNAHEQAAS